MINNCVFSTRKIIETESTKRPLRVKYIQLLRFSEIDKMGDISSLSLLLRVPYCINITFEKELSNDILHADYSFKMNICIVFLHNNYFRLFPL